MFGFIRAYNGLAIWVVLLLTSSYFIYESTGSLLYVFVTILLVFFLWGLNNIILGVIRGQSLKRFLVYYAEEIAVDELENDNYESYKQDFVYFKGRSLVATVTVVARGVFIQITGVCSCIIPWNMILNIKVLKEDKQQRVKLGFADKVEDSRNLIIPWDSEFQKQVPESVLIV